MFKIAAFVFLQINLNALQSPILIRSSQFLGALPCYNIVLHNIVLLVLQASVITGLGDNPTIVGQHQVTVESLNKPYSTSEITKVKKKVFVLYIPFIWHP